MHGAVLGTSTPPALAVLVGFAACSLAAYTDLSERKVPNWLTFSTLAIALIIAALRGLPAFEIALAMLVVALAFGVLLQSSGVLGGGDVKLLAAICVLVGFPNCVALVLYTALAGGILALISSGVQRRLRSLMRKTRDVLVQTWVAKRFTPQRAGPHSALQDRLPYALAIGAGFAVLVLSNSYLPALRIL
ncbi:MAG: prepilin peptidase [Candidatus Baltobacteraceae bacterium]